ncbi:response regulator transcription factor [Hyphomicrobium sp.]|uniref:response regulator transcription factor n=1 Tax=Hyphomicrobium sp. TaxID=82 RepID=UPI002E30EEF9|nr:response regulator [Hyphomicrobium sp.]HEX2839995.1 response regulator [Hyphomicrobium sp.]
MSKTVSVIDDEASVREAVAMLLETHGMTVNAYESAVAFLAAPFAAGCIVSDVRMPEISGLDLLRTLQSSDDSRPLILMTGHGDVELAVQAIKLGAFDFVEKPFSNDRLVGSVEQALVASESSLKVRLELEDLKAKLASLSERQRDTMQLLIRGLSNKEIGQQLGISPRTVEIHRTWVMTKMSARSIADLVRMGMALGIE